MNTTIQAKNRILSLGLALCLLLTMVLFVPGPVEVSAALPSATAGQPYDGIDFEALVGNGIYYGTYDHAVRFQNTTYGTATRENVDRPVLWRVVGEDSAKNVGGSDENYYSGGSENLTLWSEYVLDSQPFSNSNWNHWNASPLAEWLQDSFVDNFKLSEQGLIANDIAVHSGAGVSGLANRRFDQSFYLPWADVAGTTTIRLDTNDTVNSTLSYQAQIGYLRGNGQAVYYWLRSPLSYASDRALSVNTVGSVYIVLVITTLGVRPAFQLNPSSVIFTSKIVSSNGDGMGTIGVDSYYSSIAAGGGDANFKLTVVGGNNGADVGTLTGVPASSISLESGGSIWLDLESDKTTDDGDYTVNYKIVGTNGTTREIMGYGFTPAEENTALQIDASALADGTYTVYVWLQKNNEINSHEGTIPEYFTLTVDSSGDTYSFTHDATDPLSLGSANTGYNPTDYTKTVTVTTSPDPAASDLRAYLGGNDPDKFTVSTVGANGEFTIAPVLGLSADTYEATVTVAGNYAEPQSFTVKFEVTASSAPPVTLTASTPLDGVKNESYTYNLSGDAADGTPPYHFALDSGSGPLPLGLSLSAAGVIDGTPTEDGTFPFTVKVTDDAGQTDTANYTIKIYPAGTDLPPEATPLQLTLEVGESRPVNVSLGYGADAATGATITSDDGSIATASPTQLGYSGSVTVTGQSKGQTAVRIDYTGGTRGGDFDTVQVTVTDDSGGGSDPDTYAVTVLDDGNGRGTASPNPAREDDIVTLTANAHSGYQFKEWQVVSGSAVIDDTKSNPATFRMPGNAVTVKAVFESSGGNPEPTPDPGGSSGGSSGTRSGRSGSSGGSTYTPPLKTSLPASAFTWEGRTLTIDHDSITPLGLLSVQWDNVPLTRGEDYAVYQGSVIVRFSEDFMATQSPGDHTVKVEFLNHTGETTVTIGDTGLTADEPNDDLFDNNTYNPNTGGYPDGSYPATDNPNTGDGRGIWLALLLGSIGAAALVKLRPRLEVK